MLEKLLGVFGQVNGLDIGAIIASLGYLARVGLEIRNWYLERRELRIEEIILDAIRWVYVNQVQAVKAAKDTLTPEEGASALNTAVFKAIEFARNNGIDLKAEVGDEELPGRVQGLFARWKAAVGNSRKQEVLANG